MTIPVGTQGQISDIELALDGGDDFVKRLSLLNQAKEQHDVALKNLGLGKDARSMFAEAKKVAEAASQQAEELRARAQREFNDTRNNIDGMVKEAQQKAHSLMADASAQAEQVFSKAKEARRQADEYVARVHSEINDLKAKIQKSLAEIEGRKSDLENQRISSVGQQRKAEEAEANALAAQNHFNSKVSVLREALKKVE